MSQILKTTFFWDTLYNIKVFYYSYRGKYRAEVLEEVHEEIENFLKDGNNVGDVGLALETWIDIIHDIEMCTLLILSEKKEDILKVKVLESRHKCLVINYTNIK